MKPLVHPTAKVHPQARLGPYVVIGPKVEIHEGARVGSFSVIGGPPEHRAFYDDHQGDQSHGVIIEKDARVFEFVTIHSGTLRPTRLQEGAAVFNHSHIAHDCVLGKKSTVGGHASLAGHVVTMEGSFIGGLSAVHQWSVIGAYGFLAPRTFLKGFLPPGEIWASSPARPAGINKVGLERAGLSHESCLKEFLELFELLKKGSKL